MGGIVIDYPLYEARRQISMTVNDAMKRRLANMALLITGMIWGSGFVVMKNTLDSMSTNYILAIRFTIAALGLSYTLFTKGPVTFEKIKAGANLGLYIYGAFAVQTYGLMFTTAGKNALITAFYVVLVPLLLWIMQKRRQEGKVWMAAVMMIIGIALLTTDGGGSINIGDVLTLCCSLGYAIQIVLVDGYAKKYDLMQLTCLQFWFSALYGWIAALLFEQPPVNMGGDTVFALAYCGIACTLIGLTLQNVGVKYASPEYATLFMSTESAFGCIFGVIFLHETMTARMLVGGLMVVAALMLSQVEWKDVFAKRKNRGVHNA